MSRERGRIRISGFDAERVTRRDPLSEWVEETGEATEGRWTRALRRFGGDRSAMLGVLIVAGMVLAAVFARPIAIEGVTVQPFSLAPYPPEASMLFSEASDAGTHAPPSVDHPMGTDESARDVFSRVIYGARYSISIGFLVVFVTAAVGVVYGSVSGYYGGWVDEVMMRVLDVVFALPGLVLALVVVAMLGSGYVQLLLAFAVFGWAGYARLIRGEILSVKQNEYVLAAKALGATDRSIIFRHVVPNAVPPVIVQASLSVGTVVIGVAALGFLGLGFESSTPEWGTMLHAEQDTLAPGPGGDIYWWATVFPGIAIFLFVMSMNLIGDGINDALDARTDFTATQGDGG